MHIHLCYRRFTFNMQLVALKTASKQMYLILQYLSHTETAYSVNLKNLHIHMKEDNRKGNLNGENL